MISPWACSNPRVERSAFGLTGEVVTDQGLPMESILHMEKSP